MTGGGTGLPEESPTQEGGGESEEEQVMSEVHLGCPPNHSGPHISHFTVSLPPRKVEWIGDGSVTVGAKDCEVDEDCELILPRRAQQTVECIGDGSVTVGAKVCEVDEDGDLILPRRAQQTDLGSDSFVITIQHHVTSSIPSVGLQVWGAELVLADFVLHMMYNSSKFDGIVAVDLGAGTGLIGMLLARAANTVFITDHGDEVLGNCAKNVHLNVGLFHEKASVYVRELDWNHPWPPKDIENSSAQKSYGWIVSEVEELNRASLLVAADVIYNDDLTDALFSILEVLMSTDQEKVLYLALEKRYNFSMNDLDVVANGYSHFLSYLKLEDDFEEKDAVVECWCGFVGKYINLEEIPQYMLGCNRGNAVEILEIKYVKNK